MSLRIALFIFIMPLFQFSYALEKGDLVIVIPTYEMYEYLQPGTESSTFLLREMVSLNPLTRGSKIITAQRSQFLVEVPEAEGLKKSDLILLRYKSYALAWNKCQWQSAGKSCMVKINAVFEGGVTLYSLTYEKEYEHFGSDYVPYDVYITPKSKMFRRERYEMNGITKGSYHCLGQNIINEENGNVVLKSGTKVLVKGIFEDGYAVVEHKGLLSQTADLAEVKDLKPCQ
jgi:hypothetical protein